MENFIFIQVGKIYTFFAVFMAASILVIGAIMVDLCDGLYTARKTRQRIHSHKLRVTVEKVAEYERFLLMAFLIDAIGLLFDAWSLPFLTLLFAIGLMGVEVKSMFEHANRRKSNASQLPQMVSDIIHCQDVDSAMHLINTLQGKDKTSKSDAIEPNERDLAYDGDN